MLTPTNSFQCYQPPLLNCKSLTHSDSRKSLKEVAATRQENNCSKILELPACLPPSLSSSRTMEKALSEESVTAFLAAAACSLKISCYARILLNNPIRTPSLSCLLSCNNFGSGNFRVGFHVQSFRGYLSRRKMRDFFLLDVRASTLSL